MDLLEDVCQEADIPPQIGVFSSDPAGWKMSLKSGEKICFNNGHLTITGYEREWWW